MDLYKKNLKIRHVSVAVIYEYILMDQNLAD